MAQHPLKDGLSPLSVSHPTDHPRVPLDHGSTINYNQGSNMRPHPPGVGRQDGQDGIHEILYNLQTTENSLSNIPDYLLNPLIEFYSSLNTTSTIDLETPHLRPGISSTLLVLIIFFYLLLIIIGCLSNIFLFLVIIKQKLYKEAINGCLLNMVVTAIVQLLVVVPLSLYIRLVQNWMLGELGCYLVPVIQDLPSHISLLSIFVANLIRYGKLLFPASSRPTPSFLLPLCWVVGFLLVLPYLPNIRHYHMRANGPMFKGGQLCMVEEEERRGRMMRGTFILLLGVPIVTSLYLLGRVWWVLCGMERDGTVLARDDSGEETEEDIEILADDSNGNNNGKHKERISSVGSLRITRNLSMKRSRNEEEIFVTKEKETQMFLFLLLIVHVVFILPLNIFKLVLPSLKQTLTTSSQLDMTYIILLWFSFIPPVSIAPLYALWVAKRSGDQTLQDMFKIDDEKMIGQQEHERRMSNMKMEELNRRRASFIVIEDTLKSPKPNHNFLNSPQPSIKQNGSRQNSLRVAVQHRRASIVSISPDNLLEVAAGPSRSGSFRSSSNENLLMPTSTVAVVENGHTGRRKSYAPTHYGRKGSFRTRSSIKEARRFSIQPLRN